MADSFNPQFPKVTELRVNGMNCQNCARRVTEAIQSLPGVSSASVSLDGGRAKVRWTGNAPENVPSVLEAIHRAGYEAAPLERTSPELDGERRGGWRFNLWIGVLATVPLMIGEWAFDLSMARWFQWLSFALAGVVQVLGGAPFYRGAWRQLKLGVSNMDTLVALGSTTAFVYSAWALLTEHDGHVYFMEAAAIITLISFGHWLEARVSMKASSSLKALMQLAPQTARRLREGLPESRVVSLGSGTVSAGSIEKSSEAEDVPVAELSAGDLVVLRPGDRVPTDGVVKDGNSAVDESMLTGESLPVDKSRGGELYGGTVNLNGHLTMRVTAIGESTALAQIIAAVQRAQTSRANIQRLADRVSNVFVPIVILAAIATALWWGCAPESAQNVHHWLARFLWSSHPAKGALAAAFIGAASVLIIACPCAMGLATPAAIMAGANAAARRGILIRDGIALEKAGLLSAVIFDKTGTLTTGKPAVEQAWVANDPQFGVPNPPDSTLQPQDPRLIGFKAQDSRLPALAEMLASHSTHPISRAVAGFCAGIAPKQDPFAAASIGMEDWREIQGGGVQANIAGATTRLGSLRWLRENAVDLSSGQGFIAEWSSRGATIVGLAIDQYLGLLFAVKDTIKPGAAAVVEQLRRRGIETYLVTGDNSLTAASVAKQAGIQRQNVVAEARPEQKAEFVRKLQCQGQRVAFVGDGINDAPALKQADLGIAVTRASDVAREAADILLLQSGIEALPEALALARATLRTIKQNLFWAFFYNAMAVPLAATGFMSPILCAVAMGVSDLVVLGNALRLRNSI